MKMVTSNSVFHRTNATHAVRYRHKSLLETVFFWNWSDAWETFQRLGANPEYDGVSILYR